MRNKIVSSEREQLILVDENDAPVGHDSKAACHDGDGILHRAFSVFLFNSEGDLLLQKRGGGKRLWPGYWSNSCCSHPRRGETMDIATRRRLEEELGINVELEYVYRFRYQARFGDAGSEHELCSVYVGRDSGGVRPNSTEIDEIRYLSAERLAREMAERPESFTPWFKQEWERLNTEFSAVLRRYTDTAGYQPA